MCFTSEYAATNASNAVSRAPRAMRHSTRFAPSAAYASVTAPQWRAQTASFCFTSGGGSVSRIATTSAPISFATRTREPRV